MRNFVCAALPSVQRHIRSANRDYPNFLNNDSINKIFMNHCDSFLTSIGACFIKNKTVEIKHIDKYINLLKNCRSEEYMSNCKIVTDSGGYQIQTGFIKNSSELENFMNLYYFYFLQNHSDLVNKSFSIDIAPGESFSVCNSFDEIEKYNIMSYEKAIKLEDNILKNMIYIHHFRTPKLHDIYKRILFEHKFADKFEKFSTGGLVSSSGNSEVPVILYCVPLIDLLYFKKCDFSFHILGATSFKDIFTNCMLRKHIKESLGIDVHITWDSSSIIKSIGLARTLFIPDYDNKTFLNVDIKSLNLNKIYNNKTGENRIYECLNSMSKEYGLKELNNIDNPIYNDIGELNSITYAYAILFQLIVYNKVEEWSNEMVDNIYDYYKCGDYTRFNYLLLECLIKFNFGRLSRNTKEFRNKIFNSLQFLTKMDLDYSNHIVNTFLSKDEFKIGNKILTF